VWNVYVASSDAFFQSRVRAGVAGFIGEGRRGAEALAMLEEREEISAAVLPMRVIFVEKAEFGDEEFLV
jgi:hypothetical protein